MAAQGETYSIGSGEDLHAGRYQNRFDSVGIVSEDGDVQNDALTNRTIILSLHGSSGQSYIGRRYRANCSGRLAFDTMNTFDFCSVKSAVPTNVRIYPVDLNGTLESYWEGFQISPDAYFRLVTTRRLDAMLNWLFAGGLPSLRTDTTCATGGSMGGTGTLVFGVRRPNRFAALYPDRPRWKNAYTTGTVIVPKYPTGMVSMTRAAAPNLAPEDGGYPLADYKDALAYVSNAGNKIPWIGWVCGSNDGTMPWQDQLDAVVAMRATKRGFAFAWNAGNHSGAPSTYEITNSYPYGSFKIGQGYPLFTGHSGDSDPTVDAVGGINIGLSFRNVVETSSSWSCEITSILGARSVDVEPISDVFRASVTKQTISIPAANTWVPVSFSG